MFNKITTNIVYQKHCEKSNIKLLKIEDLIFNSIFIKSRQKVENEEGDFVEYRVKSCRGSFYITKEEIAEIYEIVTKDHWSRFTKLDFNSIKEHFKLMNIQLNIELKDSSIFVEYEFLEKDYYELINSHGITNVPVNVWVNIRDTKTLNTYRALEMYSHKRSFVKLSLKEQVKEFTGVSDKHLSRTINDTVKKMSGLGVEILIEYNNITNSSRTKYNNCEVVVKETSKAYEENSMEYADHYYAELQEVKEEIKEVLQKVSNVSLISDKTVLKILNKNNGDADKTVQQIKSFLVKYGFNDIDCSTHKRKLKELGGYEIIYKYFDIEE